MGNFCYKCCCYFCEKQNKTVSLQKQKIANLEEKKEINDEAINKINDLNITKQTENAEADYFYNTLNTLNTTMNDSIQAPAVSFTNIELNNSVFSNNKPEDKIEKKEEQFLVVNYKKVRSMSKLNVKNNVNFFKSSYERESSRLLVCDTRCRSLSTIDLICSKVRKLNPKSSLYKPISVCLNNKKNVIVFDSKLKKLFTFKSVIKQPNQKYSCSQPLNFILNDITIDRSTNRLYACDRQNHRLVTFESDDVDYKKPKFIKFPQLQNFSPIYIRINGDKIFVIDSQENDDSDQSSEYSNSSWSADNRNGYNFNANQSFIHIIDKNSRLILKTINHKILFKPIGLFIDNNMNIITTGYCIYKQSNISNSRYLYTLSQDGQIINRTNLYFDGILSDIQMISDEKIVLISKNDGIYIYEFDKSVKKLFSL
jgi:hypothetical protein